VGGEHPKNRGEVRGTNETRILVAFEDDYRTYADALATAIRAARPHLNVATTVGLEALQAEVTHLDPHLLICSSLDPIFEQEGKLLAWVELSLDPHQSSKFCVSGRRWESLNPSLEELLDVVEEAEQLLLSSTRRAEAC
jgi:hypothetical protein